MEVDIPYSFHPLSKNNKHTLLRAIPSLKNLLGAHLRTASPAKKGRPAVNTHIEPDTTSTELPSLQVTPLKNNQNARKRSSSTGNDAKYTAIRKVPDLKSSDSQQDRDRNPTRPRVDLAPLVMHSKSPSKTYTPVLRKPSIEAEISKAQQPEQLQRLKHRAEPIRASLNHVFGVEKRVRKESRLTEGNMPTQEKEEFASTSPTVPKVWQDLAPKDFVFSPNVPQHIMIRHFFNIVQGIKYAVGQVKPLPISLLGPLQVSLKKKNENLQKTLILDLDETLIFAKKTEEDEVKEKFPSIDGNESAVFTVKVRPYAEEFLREMSKEFEIIIFTAGEKSYAESVVKFLDPEQKYVSHLLHRGHCLRTKRGLFIKDLRVILERDLKDMVIVDNCTHSFSFQVDNGIPIITWNGELNDQELKHLMPYLLEAKKCEDMRQYNREKLRLEELSQIPLQNIPTV